MAWGVFRDGITGLFLTGHKFVFDGYIHVIIFKITSCYIFSLRCLFFFKILRTAVQNFTAECAGLHT